MEHGGTLREILDLPENDDDGFDEQALEQAIRANRQREFAALSQLNG